MNVPENLCDQYGCPPTIKVEIFFLLLNNYVIKNVDNAAHVYNIQL